MKFVQKDILVIIAAGLMILCLMCIAPVEGLKVSGSKYMQSVGTRDYRRP